MGGNEKTLGEHVRILGNRAKHTWEEQVRRARVVLLCASCCARGGVCYGDCAGARGGLGS